MNKFGLLDDDEPQEERPESFSERLASFPVAAPKHRIDVAAADAAAAPHGFISREAVQTPALVQSSGRRRRIVPVEATRHLAIRLAESQYDRFVAYADRHRLTYHDAIARLLDKAQD